jgi:hypothetical protein
MLVSQSKFLNRMFRRINGLVWDITTGGVGLETENGIYSLSITPAVPARESAPAVAATYGVSVNPLEGLGIKLPAFATQASFDEVNAGDLIVGDQGIIGWVIDKTAAAFKVLDHNGNVKTYIPPKVQILGTSGVLVVRNLFSLTGGADGANALAGNLLPLLILGGGDEKMEKMLPLLLMTSRGAAAGGSAAANPMANMLPLLMMKEGGLGGAGGKFDPITLLALSGGFGGGGAGGMNPMVMMALLGDGDLFGGSNKAPKALAPVTRGGIPVLNNGL